MKRFIGSVIIALVSVTGAQAQSIDQDRTSIAPAQSICDECQDLAPEPVSMREVISIHVIQPSPP